MSQKNTMKQADSEFVCKLCDMIEKYPSVINWSQKGDRMNVFNIKQMEQKVLPQYFRHSNFPSFIRQLNMYDFHKLQKDDQSSQQLITFEHKIFKKGNQRNYHFIQRKKKNKEHDLTIMQFQKKNQSIISKIYNQKKFSPQIKNSIAQLLQFKFISTENTKKIKSELQKVHNELRECRSKKITNAIKEIKDKLMDQMSQQILISKMIDSSLQHSLLNERQNSLGNEKQNQPRLANHLNSPFYHSVMSKDTYSFGQIVFDCNGMHSKPSFIAFPSHCGYFNQMSVNDIGNSHQLFFGNLPMYSNNGFEEKVILSKQQEQESDDSLNSMNKLNEEELKQLLNEGLINNQPEGLKQQDF